MRTKRRLQDLTIKDNFMFCAVMSEEENCIGFLEMVLGFPIAKIDVSYERNMVYHPEYKGIRLDVYAKDEANKHYNVEMQVRREISIEKRARYLKMDVGPYISAQKEGMKKKYRRAL